jgi:hypothetical protein
MITCNNPTKGPFQGRHFHSNPTGSERVELVIVAYKIDWNNYSSKLGSIQIVIIIGIN